MRTLTVKAPAIVLRHLRGVDEELKDITSVLAFKWGCPQAMHFNRIGDMVNLVHIGSDSVGRETAAVRYCDTVLVPIFKEIAVKKTINETQAQAIVDFYFVAEAFWAGMSGDKYNLAIAELAAFNQRSEARTAH